MIYITGDTHADFSRFNTRRFPEQKEMTKDDIVIILGDFGGVWYDCPEEKHWLDWLSEKPFTICYVGGNHENYDRYFHTNEFETIDFHGGKAQKIRDNIYHLMRGYIFDFEGKKFFAMGGASSHDIDDGILNPSDFANENEFKNTYNQWTRQGKMFRVNHFSWWEEELPNQDEMDFGMKTLKENDYKVDYVISHCLPQEIASVVSKGFYKPDSLTMYFNELLRNGLQFEHWYCGHYHNDIDVLGKFHIRYYSIERII